MVRFHPLGDRVLVKRSENINKTQSGLYIPETAQEKSMEGVVVAVGPGSHVKAGHRKQMHLAVGDRVVFGKWAGTEVKLDGEEYILLTEENVIGVLRKTNNV